VVVGEPVGVVGERGFLRQDGQPGEQGAGRVGEQVIDVGDPAGAGQLQREQGQQPRRRRDDRGARIPGLAGQGGQIQGYQVRDGQQQPGQPGLGAGGEGGEVDDRGPGQLGVPAGGRRAGAGLGRGAAQQPAEPLLGEDLPDPGAVERGPFGAQPGTDLVHRQARPAQLERPGAGAVLGRGGLGAGPAGRGEQLQLPGPEVAQQAGHTGAGVADPGAGLGDGQALGEVGAQRLIPPLVRVPGGSEVLRAGGRIRCHVPGLPELPCERPQARTRHVSPESA
jgi:hypothetical protein